MLHPCCSVAALTNRGQTPTIKMLEASTRSEISTIVIESSQRRWSAIFAASKSVRLRMKLLTVHIEAVSLVPSYRRATVGDTTHRKISIWACNLTIVSITAYQPTEPTATSHVSKMITCYGFSFLCLRPMCTLAITCIRVSLPHILIF